MNKGYLDSEDWRGHWKSAHAGLIMLDDNNNNNNIWLLATTWSTGIRIADRAFYQVVRVWFLPDDTFLGDVNSM